MLDYLIIISVYSVSLFVMFHRGIELYYCIICHNFQLKLSFVYRVIEFIKKNGIAVY